MNSSDDLIGPFGRSFIGDFPTIGTMSLLISTFFFSALFSLGNLIPFLILFLISSSSIVYISYNFIEPHFNERIYISKKKSLPKIQKDDALSMSEIGILLYGRSADKFHRWNFSHSDWFQPSTHKNTGASQKIGVSWLIIVVFLVLYALLGLLILPFMFIVPVYLITDISIGQYWFLILLSELTLIPIILIFIYLDGSLNRTRDMLRLRNMKRALLLILAIPAVVTIIDFILTYVYAFVYFGIFGDPSLDTDLGVTFNSNSFEILMIFLVIAIIGPISEELMFRGYVLDSIQRIHGEKVAILVSSILFGLLHLLGGWYIVGSAFIGGLIYAWLRVKTDSLIPCIVSHMMWNAFAVIVTYL